MNNQNNRYRILAYRWQKPTYTTNYCEAERMVREFLKVRRMAVKREENRILFWASIYKKRAGRAPDAIIRIEKNSK